LNGFMKDRAKEPTTIAGLGGLGFGVQDMAITDPSMLNSVGEVLGMAVPVLLAPTPLGIASLGMGLFMTFFNEGKKA